MFSERSIRLDLEKEGTLLRLAPRTYIRKAKQKKAIIIIIKVSRIHMYAYANMLERVCFRRPHWARLPILGPFQ